MVFANLTYLDSFNRSIALCSYKALMALLWRTGFYWADSSNILVWPRMACTTNFL